MSLQLLSSVVVKDLRLKDKEKESSFKDKDKDLMSKDEDLKIGPRVKDKDFPRGQQHCCEAV